MTNVRCVARLRELAHAVPESSGRNRGPSSLGNQPWGFDYGDTTAAASSFSLVPSGLIGGCVSTQCQYAFPERSVRPVSTAAIIQTRYLTGLVLGREDDSGPSEKRYWRARPCNTAQVGGEASALGSNGWRVSMSPPGID